MLFKSNETSFSRKIAGKINIFALFLLAFLIFSEASQLHAQKFHKSERDADIVEYTGQEGLPSTNLSNIVQTPDGYVWLSGIEGTYRFDGYHFEEVMPEIGLPDAQGLYFDSTQNTLYFASPQKFYVFNDSKFSVYGQKEGYRINGLPGQVVLFVKGDNRGRVWVGSETPYVDKKNNGGLTVFEDGRFTVFDSTSFPLDKASGFFETPYGDLIFTSDGKNTQKKEGANVALYKNGVFTRVLDVLGKNLENNVTQGLDMINPIDSEGNTWLAFVGRSVARGSKSAGAMMYDGSKFQRFPGLTNFLSDNQRLFAVSYSKVLNRVIATSLNIRGFSSGDKTIFEMKNNKWVPSALSDLIVDVKNLKSGEKLENFHYSGVVLTKKNRYFPELLNFFSTAQTVSSKNPNQMFFYNGKRWQKYDAFNGFFLRQINNGLLLNTSAGFGVYYPNESKMLTQKDGLLLNRTGIPLLYSDRKGLVWISYSYSELPVYTQLNDVGLNIWDGQKLHTITQKDGLWANSTFNTYQDHRFRVWVCTSKGLNLAREIQNSKGEWIFKFEKVYQKETQKPYNVSSVYETSNGDIYVWQNYVRPESSPHGIANFFLGCYNGKTLDKITSPFSKEENIKKYQLLNLIEMNDGKIWFEGKFSDIEDGLATAPSKVLIFNGTSWVKPTRNWGIPKNQLHFVGKLKSGLFFLTIDGFYQFDGNRFTNLIDSVNTNADFRLLKGASVVGTSTNIQSHEKLYIRLRNKGLVVFDGTNLELYTKKNGLPSANLFNPTVNSKEDIFFCHQSGALSVKDGKFLAYYDEENVATGGPYSATEDGFGNLVLFYNGVGLYIKTQDIRKFSMKISSVIVDTSSYFYSFPKEFPYNRNSIIFNYSALNFKNPKQTSYEHILDGYDKKWSRAGNLSFSEYQNLPHGDYIFRVKGYAANGIPIDEVLYSFHINPPFWKTWWAYLTYLLFFALILLFIRKYEKRRLRLKEAEKRQEERSKVQLRESELRAKAAELQAKAAEAQNRAIQSENERKTKELEEARALQLSLLPKDVPIYPNLQISAYMKTATEVGGDYYDFSYKNDDTLNVAIGDATGHGMKAGTLVTAMKALFASGSGAVDIEPFFISVNSGIKKMNLERVMMGFAMLNINQNKVKLINAGMPPVLLYKKKKDEVEEIKVHGMPLGAMENVKYEATALTLSSGDALLMMSDGMPELQNNEGEMFGYERITAHFKQIAENSPEEIISQFKNAGLDWGNGKDPDDDVTFVVIKMR